MWPYGLFLTLLGTSAALVTVLAQFWLPVSGPRAVVTLGLVTVVCLAPSVHEWVYQEPLLRNARQQRSHRVAMWLSAGLLLHGFW
ncbi:MAG: hypothetical protein VKP62_01640 [Candidatus Sericytochromatia bacterium]|nr:hypothetical protein [Candidatus Sericytochromatia bacterium]